MKTCRLKICGLSRFGDILAANEIQPDYIGFVFAESSRRVTPDKAAQLRQVLDKRIRAVGVFVNASMEEILELAGNQGTGRVIDLIQLHGDEDEAYIRQLKQHTVLPVIKAIRVRNREQILKAQELPCDYLLLDTYAKGKYGGSGTQFDWDMIPGLTKPYFLAGGLHLGNIRQAAAHGPYCIDVSSAVETGGRKDRRKMEELAQVLRGQTQSPDCPLNSCI